MPQTDARSISALLAPARVRVGLEGRTKAEVIENVVVLLDGAPGVADVGRVREDVARREALMTTGVGRGLALPHARSAGVTETVAAFAVTAGPIDYGAFDGEPVRLVLLMATPESVGGTHVRLLSRISRLMSDNAVRARLLAAADGAAVLTAFQEAEEKLG